MAHGVRRLLPAYDLNLILCVMMNANRGLSGIYMTSKQFALFLHLL